MCHFCHVLGNNPRAPKHHAPHCKDKGNTYSKVPLKDRMYENGKLILSSSLNTESNSADQHLCTICMDGQSNMTFVPCGHVAACEACASKVQICPICRQTITSRLKLFFV